MKRSFVYLAIVTLMALVVLVLFAPNEQVQNKNSATVLLLAEVAGQINDVNRVEIVAAGSRPVATLLKTTDGWQFEQMGGYRADWPKLQSLLAALATARVVEAKTDNPEYYARLGVEDISHQDAEGVLVRLGIDDQMIGVLIGHQAQSRRGQYVRLEGSLASAMVDQQFEVSTTPLDWAESRIIDINASEVAEVEVIHPDKARVFITRISADQTDFDLVGLPLDREIKSSWAVNSLASVLSMLNMEAVRADADVDWGAATKFRLLTFSGLEIMAEVMQEGEDYLFRLQASHPSASIVKAASAAAESSAEQTTDMQAANDVEKMVNAINQKSDGWVYVISSSKYQAMSKKPEELLKPVESV